MKPGNFMEWLSDNPAYEDELSTSRLEALVAACLDIHHVNCWMKLFELMASSSALSVEERLDVYILGCSTAGMDLFNGYHLWSEYLNFVDDEFDDEESIQGLVKRVLSIPFVDYSEYEDKIIDEYQPEGIDEIIEKVRMYEKEIEYFEAWIALKECTPDSYHAYIKFMEESKFDAPLIMSVYNNALNKFPHEERLWMQFYERFHDASILKRARKRNPWNPRFWIEEALACEKTLPHLEVREIYLLGIQAAGQLCGLDSKESLLIAKNYISMLWRTGENMNQFFGFSLSLVQPLAFSRVLKQRVLQQIGEIAYRTGCPNQGKVIFEEVLANTQDPEAWLKFAELEAVPNPNAGRQVYRSAPKCVEIAEAWIEFEHLCGDWDTFCEARNLTMSMIPAAMPEVELVKPVNAAGSKRQRDMEEEKEHIEEPEHIPVHVEQVPVNKEVTVHVGNIDFKVSEGDLRGFFEKQVGPVVSVVLGRKPTGESRGFAHVEFTDTEAAAKAMSLNRTRLNGRPVFISPYKTVGGKDWKPTVKFGQDKDPRTLYVCHLMAPTTEQELRDLFQPHPGLASIRMPITPAGTCKGFAYVEFNSSEEAQSALAENGKILHGQAISVQVSDPALAPKKQVQKLEMKPPSLSRPRPKARLNL